MKSTRVLGLLLCVSLGAACAAPEAPRDASGDRSVRDVASGDTEAMDATVDVQGDIGGDQVATNDSATPEDDAAWRRVCCRAFSTANQGICDNLEPLGPSRCNMLDDGMTCAWSPDPMCHDGGTGMGTGCCIAVNPANQTMCSTVAAFGSSSCNAFADGRVCRWSRSSACNPTPDAGTPDAGSMDSGITCCTARIAANEPQCSPLATRSRCTGLNGGLTCNWSASAACNPGDAGTDAATDVRDAGATGCCLARTANATNTTYCRAQATQATCSTSLAAFRTCAWSTVPGACAGAGATAGACCQPTTSTAAICAANSTAAQCGGLMLRGCAWRCP
ncbi:MAG: hypothetical protein Q8Q09_14130 [Deltaproteobacteria bacterium]|nr:hypothetical protein [Deltaproteobacteria bacterium]